MRYTTVWILAIVCAANTATAFAQQASPTTASQAETETVVLRKSDLTADQLAKIQIQETVQQLGAYKEYAEMGRGVGLAIGETLRAVKDVAVDFSKTDVGKYAMFLIAWKIMAKDVISMGNQVFGYLIGIPLLFIGGLALLWSYRRQCFARRVLIESTKEGGKKWAVVAPNGQIFNLEKDVDNDLPDKDVSARAAWAVGHVVVGALFLTFCSLVIF